jgi:signal transduction histidine kinase
MGGVRERPVHWFAAAIVPAASLALATAALIGGDQIGRLMTRFSQASPSFLALDAAAGLILIALGSIAWLLGRRSVGLATILAGSFWLGADLAGDTTVSGIVRAAGLVAVVETLPAVGWATFAAVPAGSRTELRSFAVIAVVLGGLASLWVVALVPELDARCLAVCDTNPLGLGIDFHLARLLSDAWEGLTLVGALAMVAMATRSWRREPSVGGHGTRVVLAAAVGVGIAWAGWATSQLLPATVIDPRGPQAQALFVVRAVALSSFGIAIGVWTARILAVRRNVQRLADRLSPFPRAGSLENGLATALSDPTLRVVFPVPGAENTIDSNGEQVLIPARATTEPIRSRSGVVAIVVRAIGAPVIPLNDQLGASLVLAADNERLLATVRHEVNLVRSSRARIVATGDVSRRQLERDLHDGAQQRMLAVVHDLAAVTAESIRESNTEASTIAELAAEADRAANALRRVARGLYPQILEEEGLAAAIESFADDASVPMILGPTVDRRCSAPIEAAAYRAIVRGVGLAGQAGAGSVDVSIGWVDDRLDIELGINGIRRSIDSTPLADVIGAAGGELNIVGVGNRDQQRIRASLPCA